MRILILGGGVMQLPAVRLARANGWAVVVAAAEIGKPVRESADLCVAVDLRDREAVAAEARRLAEGEGLDGVFTAGTDFSTTVAWVAERLGLPGISYEAAQRATDKSRMRAAFDRNGVRSPRFFTATERLQALPEGFRFPLVVKPVDNMGARGVRRVDEEAELREALNDALGHSACGRAIVEQYLEGPELSLDAIVDGGSIVTCGVADRHIRFAPYFVEMGHTMPSALPSGRLRAAEQLFVRAIRALGIDSGAAKGDIKLTREGPVVGEVAARLSGGYMSGWTFPLASGVQVTAAALNIAVGLPPGPLEPLRSWVSAERAFISIPGTVQAIECLEEARRRRRVEEVFLRVGPGSKVELPIDNLGKCGNVISAAPGREEAVEAAEGAAREILVRLRADDPRTDAFLNGRLQGGFRAFPEASAGLLRAVDRLPPLTGPAIGPDSEAEPGLPPGRGSWPRLVILPVASRLEAESARDWHGGTLAEALDRVRAATGARVGQRVPAGSLAAGSLFWKALLKGGVQAGVYVLDSLVSAAAGTTRRGRARRFIGRWEGLL